jgi:D-arabinose 1-dehydrogenase-like Zn-dependent alcohol dehydrogenase
MDSRENRKTMTRCLQTTGQGYFEEVEYDKPEPTSYEIEVKAVMTGVCRSDIDMMLGDFGPLPLHMQGHEGIGRVTKVGSNVVTTRVGDYVATRGEPAYADYYNVRMDEYVEIPEADPKYILEPVACGINLIEQAKTYLQDRQGTHTNNRMLIIGSGFLAWVAYHTMRLNGYIFHVDVLGSNNQELWGDKLLLGTSESYDVVVDLTGKYELGTEISLNDNAVIIDGVGKSVSKHEAQAQLWKAVTTVKPSPRNPKFIDCMHIAKYWIENGYLEVDSFWTRCYNRTTEWQQAFADGKDRPNGYSRGYIKWD